jgi:ABC-type sugar transport system substrate-binding protein
MRRARLPPPRAVLGVLLAVAGAAWPGISGCRRGEAADPGPAKAPAVLRLGLSIADLSDPRIDALRAAAADAHVELMVGGKGVKPQPLQVAELLQAKVAALLLVPSSPDLLHEIDRTASAKSVALVAIGRGDGRVGAWVGLRSATLAKEAGEAAGRALLAAGCTKPRVIVLESSRWPETSRRIEATLQGIAAACGGVEVVVRLTECEGQAETERLLDEGLPRTVAFDALVAAEPGPTAAAWSALARTPSKDHAFVVGVSDDDALVEKARAAGSRLVVVAWKRSDLGAKAIDAALAAAKGDRARSLQEVSATVVGAGR